MEKSILDFWNSVERAIQSFTNSSLVTTIVVGVIIIVATMVVSHFLKKFIRHLANKGDNNLTSTSLVINIERGLVWGIGICTLLAVCFGMDVTAVIAALGIGGIALSLGLQDTISNLIGGIQISFKGIVKPGDHVSIDGQGGVVHDINLRFTTIHTITGEKLVIPNSVMTSSALTVFPSWHNVKVRLSIPFESAAYYESTGMTFSELIDAIRSEIYKGITNPSPQGLGLKLEGDVDIVAREVEEYSYRTVVSVWIDKDSYSSEGNKQVWDFDRIAVEDVIVRAAAPYLNKGRM